MLQISDRRATKLLALSDDDAERLGLKSRVFIVDPCGNVKAA